MKNAIVTGATGVIGSALVKELLKNGIRVSVIVRKESKTDIFKELEGISFIYSDLNDLESVNTEEKFDTFFHLGWDGTRGASRLDKSIQERNIKYTVSAVNLAKRLGCKSFVGVGSQAEYGKVKAGEKISPNTTENPESEYGKAKLKACKEAKLLCKEYGIRFSWCRVLSTYGIYDGANTLIMHTIKECLAGNECDLTLCEQEWDYIYNEDIARGLILISKKGKDGVVYVIGAGHSKPLNEYVKTIYNEVNNPDAKLNFGAVDYYPDQVMYLCADISALTKDTGFIPKVSFEDGIRKTIEWYKNTANEKD